MARSFITGSLTRLNKSTASGMPTAYPISVLARAFNNSTIVGAAQVSSVMDESTTDQGSSIQLWYDGADLTAKAHIFNGAAVRSITSSTKTLNTWYSLGARHNTSLSELFVDGVSAGTASTAVTFPAALDQITIGGGGGSSPGLYITGDINDVAWYNVLLTDAEMVAFAKGVSPNRIRPQNLIAYIPVMGASPEPDMSGTGNNMTVQNSPAVADNYISTPFYQPVGASVDMFGALSLGDLTVTSTQSGNAQVTKGRTVFLYNRDTGALEQTGVTDENGLCTFTNVPNVNGQGYYTVTLDDN